jgi:hypothetical protein
LRLKVTATRSTTPIAHYIGGSPDSAYSNYNWKTKPASKTEVPTKSFNIWFRDKETSNSELKTRLVSAVVDGSLDNFRMEKIRSREHQQICEGPAGFKNGPG